MQQHDAKKQLGNYRMLRLLGQGGSACVYLGEHVYLKTLVAVKILQEKMGTADVESFLKEAQTIASLKHPHILRVLDFGMESSIPFLVMEYIPGGTLRQKHPRGSRIPLSIVVSYVKQIAMALQYAHDQKLVHRDVKPENILVEAEDKLVLSDFGIAIAAHHTQSLSIQVAAGTALYMAPEQTRGKARPASDQYALGVLTYEWLSGVHPFSASTAIGIAMQHLLDLPPPLREKVPNIPEGVERVVLKTLVKEPQQRFTTIQDFANALEQAYQATLSASRPSEWSTQPLDEGAKLTLSTELLLTYQGHFKEVCAIAWSPDGSHIASGGRDETVQIWNASTGWPTLTYRGHCSKDYSSTVGVSTVAWSPDGSHIASAGNDETAQLWNGTVHIWNASTGKRILTYGGQFGSVRTVAWSPNGTHIASLGGWNSSVDVWDSSTGNHTLTYQGHSSFVHQVAWSPDSTYIASGGDDKIVQVWHASTGVLIKTYNGHTESITAITWSPDGTRIATGSNDGAMHVWDISAGRHIWHHDAHFDRPWPCLKWSPNGRYIASSGGRDSSVDIWDASTGELLLTYHGHSSSVKAIAWSPDGSRIVSGDYQGIVQVWQIA